MAIGSNVTDDWEEIREEVTRRTAHLVNFKLEAKDLIVNYLELQIPKSQNNHRRKPVRAYQIWVRKSKADAYMTAIASIPDKEDPVEATTKASMNSTGTTWRTPSRDTSSNGSK